MIGEKETIQKQWPSTKKKAILSQKVSRRKKAKNRKGGQPDA